MRIGPDGVWRATRTPDGPATTHFAADGERITVQAWGKGAEWALHRAPDIVGAHDSEDGFDPRHPVLREIRRRLRGLRIGRSHAVVEALVPTVIEQKVIGIEAKRAFAKLVRRYGEPAPGPGELLLPPSPAHLAAMPSYAYHPLGIERRRADIIRRACSYAHRLEEACAMAPADALQRLTALPGLGPWTAAEVALVALGDADAVSVGDYHLPNHVAFGLAGEPRADDDRMLELLEPYRGHRGRVIRLLVAGGPSPPRYGPRLEFQDIAGL
jgi:3-methyladenine DNA glycosylase/8-oxoguanine DNA glycosylase